MPRPSPPNVISISKPFDVNGIAVVEIIRKPDPKRKDVFDLTWVRHPWEAEQVDGKDNNYFHCEYGRSTRRDYAYTRSQIRPIFLKYWSKVELWVPPGT